jgi:hypothetical protein
VRRFLLAFVAAFVFAAPAAAGDVHVRLGFSGGALSLATRAPDGTGRIPLTVRDARGTGAGWELRLRGTATVAAVLVRCAPGSTCTLPRSGVSYPVAPGARTVPVLVAGRDSGMGAVDVLVQTRGGGSASFSVVSR